MTVIFGKTQRAHCSLLQQPFYHSTFFQKAYISEVGSNLPYFLQDSRPLGDTILPTILPLWEAALERSNDPLSEAFSTRGKARIHKELYTMHKEDVLFHLYAALCAYFYMHIFGKDRERSRPTHLWNCA